ncbi:uncharacterized protein LOC142800416 [Rhipicephalus microplus]|uniref:uncharacterized protein LOC142800416 n=1 Tax=Rhipicephalus microplus TaxID=6941 RepID=UPI003F6D40E8
MSTALVPGSNDMRWKGVTLALLVQLSLWKASSQSEAPWEGKDLSLPEPPSDLPRLIGVEVACGKRHMRVQLQFSAPFNGIVFSKGHHGQPECVYVGPRSGITAANFDVFYDRCGTKPDHHGSFYENTIVVQYGVDIIEAWDEAKRLRCEWHDAYEKSALRTPSIQLADLDVQELNFQGDSVGCWMEIQEGKGPWAKQVSSIVPLGSPLTMVIAINDRDKQFDMRVKSCAAHDGLRGPIQLTDDRGCVLRPKMLTAFMKVRDFSGKASVVAFSHFYAFKFPDTIEVQIQCVVEICRHGCPDDCPGHEQHPPHGGGGDLPPPNHLEEGPPPPELHHHPRPPHHQRPHYASSSSEQDQKLESPPSPHHQQQQHRDPQREGVAAGSSLHAIKRQPQPPQHQQSVSATQPPVQHQTVPFGLPLLSVNVLPNHYYPPTPPGVHMGPPHPHNVVSVHQAPPPHLSFPPMNPHLQAMPRRPSYEEAEEQLLQEGLPKNVITDAPQFSTTPSQHESASDTTSENKFEPITQKEYSRDSQLSVATAPPKEKPTLRPLYYEAPKSAGAPSSRFEQPDTTTNPSLSHTEDEYEDETTSDMPLTTTATTASVTEAPFTTPSRDTFNMPPPVRPYPKTPPQEGSIAEGNQLDAPDLSSAKPVFFTYSPPSRAPAHVPIKDDPSDTDGNGSSDGRFSAIRPRPPAPPGATGELYQPARPHFPYPMSKIGLAGAPNPDAFQERVDIVAETASDRPSTVPRTETPHDSNKSATPTTETASSTTTTADPTHVHKVPIQASVALMSGRFPNGPRSLKTKRNAVGSSDQLGVRGSLRVIAGVDLAFLPNVTRDDAAVFTGRYEEIIYGVCLPATGLAASVGAFVLLILCTTCIAAYLYYVLRTYEAKSKQSFVLRRFLSTYRNRKMKH